MKILIFGFKNTIAEQIIKNLQPRYVCEVLESSEQAIEALVLKIQNEKYDLVLGLGQYSGKDVSHIRIETNTTSQFRNNTDNLYVLKVPYFFKPNDHFKLTNAPGNSWCNLVSYKITSSMTLQKYTFLHIPYVYDIHTAIKAILEQLQMTE